MCPRDTEPADTHIQGESFSASSSSTPQDNSVQQEPLTPTAPSPEKSEPFLYASTQKAALPASTVPGLTGDNYYDQWLMYWWSVYQSNPSEFKRNPLAFLGAVEIPDSIAQESFWNLYNSI